MLSTVNGVSTTAPLNFPATSSTQAPEESPAPIQTNAAPQLMEPKVGHNKSHFSSPSDEKAERFAASERDLRDFSNKTSKEKDETTLVSSINNRRSSLYQQWLRT